MHVPKNFVQYCYQTIPCLFLSLAEPEFGKPDKMLSGNFDEEHDYSLRASPGSDVDDEADVEVDPSPSICLWMGEAKSEPSSCLSSRANSVLSLTDTEQDRKSVCKNGKYCFKIISQNTVYIISKH